jgi:hypothetical protein
MIRDAKITYYYLKNTIAYLLTLFNLLKASLDTSRNFISKLHTDRSSNSKAAKQKDLFEWLIDMPCLIATNSSLKKRRTFLFAFFHSFELKNYCTMSVYTSVGFKE